MEVKAAQKITDTLLGGFRGQPLQVQERACVQVQRLQLMLGKITDRHVLSRGPLTPQQGALPPQGIHQRGLARTIGAQETNTTARQQ